MEGLRGAAEAPRAKTSLLRRLSSDRGADYKRTTALLPLQVAKPATEYTKNKNKQTKRPPALIARDRFCGVGGLASPARGRRYDDL